MLGRDSTQIEDVDSDGDGFSNIEEISAMPPTFPGDASDYPTGGEGEGEGERTYRCASEDFSDTQGMNNWYYYLWSDDHGYRNVLKYDTGDARWEALPLSNTTYPYIAGDVVALNALLEQIHQPTISVEPCDVNADGHTDSLDASLIKLYILYGRDAAALNAFLQRQGLGFTCRIGEAL